MVGFLILLAFLDQLTKGWAEKNPTWLVEGPGGYIAVESAINPVGPLGLPISGGWLIWLAIPVVVGLVALATYEEKRFIKIFLWAVVYGVLSNTWDRVSLGHVVDVFKIYPGIIFNLADVMLVGGVALVVLFHYRYDEVR